jgi:hypothetical protein
MTAGRCRLRQGHAAETQACQNHAKNPFHWISFQLFAIPFAPERRGASRHARSPGNPETQQTSEPMLLGADASGYHSGKVSRAAAA